ncbi:MAG: N-acetylneuraminate synthase family protein [Magnetococcales bacterium]|nr:N-acetylneuraminate synthase family protein [Magnetococcales bacterium]
MLADVFSRYRASGHVYVIAEAGLNHNGSLDMAKALIDVAVVAGADAVKFQKRTVDRLAVREVLDAPDNRFPEFGTTYRQIREHLEFGWDDYVQIKDYCAGKGIDFLCTAFDAEAVDFLERLGVAGYKLASHSLTNLGLLEVLAALGKPTILSTGMAEWEEIDRAVAIFKKNQTPLALLHCVSSYPTPLDQCNLSLMDILRQRYNLVVGYSGHELGTLPTLTAVAMGAAIVERHITLDAGLPGFDHKLSLEPDRLIRMVKDIRAIETMFGSGDKRVSAQEKITRDKYHVSMATTQSLSPGTVLTQAMITWRNPGTGIPPKDAGRYFGRAVTREIAADVLVTPDMFE